MWVLALTVLAAGILNVLFVTHVPINHDAMAPTLLRGERALLWRDAEPDAGDVVVCEHPGHSGRYVMGRVVGTPGMRLKSERGEQLWIDGETAAYDIREDVRFEDAPRDVETTMQYGIETIGNTEHEFFRAKDDRFRLRPTKVNEGLFLLSDNRTYRGEDSRTFGEVDPSTCIGQVFMRLKPAAEAPAELDHGWLDLID